MAYSAIVFIVQFYVYSILVPVVMPHVRAVTWPLVFAATGGLLVLFAWTWERFRLERLLTVQPLLQPLPTRAMRVALATGLAAITLLLSAHVDVLVRPRWHALRAAATVRDAAPRHL